MIFLGNYPRDNMSTDFCDSARLAGMMVIAKWPNFVIAEEYMNKDRNLVRSPQTNIDGDKCQDYTSFSRDQLLPLVAGYHLQGSIHMCKKILDKHRADGWWCQNKDWLSPSHRMHLKLCANEKPNWFEKLWFWCEILVQTKITYKREPNQIIAMVYVAGGKYLEKYIKWHRGLKEAIFRYWTYDDGYNPDEPELAKALSISLGLL